MKPAPGSPEEAVVLWLLATDTVETEVKVRSKAALPYCSSCCCP